MRFFADLHVHSKYSRATSKQCDLDHLALWGRKKGISVLATGDFTHPGWFEELREGLLPAEPGLWRLREERERAVAASSPAACGGSVRFLLSVEISTIYKRGEKTRKVHHVVYVPDFEAAERVITSLGRIGNLASDGRPILGLDSRHLLEIVLEAGAGSYLVPAHIWTPWFAALGSKSGFDSIEECYGDLSSHIFAVETGLSSDPAMNWRVGSLDRFRLVSNSDAHSPEKLGREACIFDTEPSYFAIREALETGVGYGGTVELFPEEGKYHLDGHRACGLRMEPSETRAHAGRCPECGRAVTVGVMHRVDELADREEPAAPPTAGEVKSLVPLREILAEILGCGAKTKAVARVYEGLLERVGPELELLSSIPPEAIAAASSPLIGEAISRLRAQEVIREAGYDGEYGTIRLFQDEELHGQTLGGSLFGAEAWVRPKARRAPREKPAEEALAAPARAPKAAVTPQRSPEAAAGASSVLAGLDPEQAAAAGAPRGALLIVAGPGSGKTRTLTHRIAHHVLERGVEARACLAITFTRRACEELRERLRGFAGDGLEAVGTFTFHALGHAILAERAAAVGLPADFRIASELERISILRDARKLSERQARKLLSAISTHKRTRAAATEGESIEALEHYTDELRKRGLVDYEDLVGLPVELLESDAGCREELRRRFASIFVDEYQDVDAMQYRLVRALAGAQSDLCVIGDPDQAIYGFRGADVRFFQRFQQDYPEARVVRLHRNYRSTRSIVDASAQVLGEGGGSAVSAGAAEPLTIHESPTERAEAELVVKTIEGLIGGHSFFSIDSGRAGGGEPSELSFSDFAVLVRTEAQTEALEEALGRSGMPFQRRSHSSLMEHAGVRAMVDGLTEESVRAPLAEWLSSRARELSEARPKEASCLAEALELLQAAARASGEKARGLLRELALASQIDTWDPRADRVSLLTLHAAKGLEFRVVFLLGCEEGVLPLSFGGEPSAAELEEERRLFYVGMTRACERLYLCHARRRLWRGKVRDMKPSRFLQRIHEELLERRRSTWAPKPARDDSAQLELF